MVGLVVEIGRCGIYEVFHTLDVDILEHLLAVNLGKAAIEYCYRHALATVALVVKTYAPQCLYLCLGLTIGNVIYRVPGVESVAVFLGALHPGVYTVGRSPHPCGRLDTWQSPYPLQI